jgi:hypothetical protein
VDLDRSAHFVVPIALSGFLDVWGHVPRGDWLRFVKIDRSIFFVGVCFFWGARGVCGKKLATGRDQRV